MAEKDHFMRLVTFNVEVCPKPMQYLFIEKAKADTRPYSSYTNLDVYLNHHSATIQHMLNKNYIQVDPRSPTVDISQWDTTMVTSMLQNIFKQSPSNHTFELNATEKGHIETIRKIRNNLQHTSTEASIKEGDFQIIWTQLESAVYGIANAVGGSCLTKTTEHVEELKSRSLPGQDPGLRILIQWYKEFYDEAKVFYYETKTTLQSIEIISKGTKDISRSTIENLEKQTGKIIKKLKTSPVDRMKEQLKTRRSHNSLSEGIEHCPEVDELFSKLNTHHRVIMIDYSKSINTKVAFAAMDKMGYGQERSVELQSVDEWQHVFCDDVDVVLFIDPFGKREYDPLRAKAMAEKIDEILDVTKLSKDDGRIDVLIYSRNDPYQEWLEHYDNHELLEEVVEINKPTTEETPITLNETVKLHSQMDHDSTTLNVLVQSWLYIEDLQMTTCDQKTVREAKDMLQRTNCIMITGPNSYNMSILGAHLMKPYHQQECLVLTDPIELKHVALCHDLKLKKRSHVISVVMIENFAGRLSYSLAKAEKWVSKFDVMYAAVKARKLKVIMTCKSDHLKKVEAKLPTHGMFVSKFSLSKKNDTGFATNVKLEPGTSQDANDESSDEVSDDEDEITNVGLAKQERKQSPRNTTCVFTAGHIGSFSLKIEEGKEPCQISGCCQGPNDTFILLDRRNVGLMLISSVDFCVLDHCDYTKGSAVVYPFMNSEIGVCICHSDHWHRVCQFSLLSGKLEKNDTLNKGVGTKHDYFTLCSSRSHFYTLDTKGTVNVYNELFTIVLTIKTSLKWNGNWPFQRMAVNENGTNVYVSGWEGLKCFDQFGEMKWDMKKSHIDKTILLSIVDENVLVFNTLTKRILEITPAGVVQHILDIPETYGKPSAFCFTKDMKRLIMPELDTDNLHVFSITNT